jgi:hypothetical protein
MSDRKIMKKLILLVFTAAIILCGSAAVFASYARPPRPAMDYVPQNLGIYDTYYENFQEPDCRVCHGASLAERHHNTPRARRGNCQFCHKDACGLAPRADMDCKSCHIDGGPIGDFGNMHHKSDLADSDQCNQCHLFIVETFTVDPPTHQPTSATPTPYVCGNCHWPSGNTPHQPPYLEDWESWEGIPKPTYTNGIGDPQPIEACGKVWTGVLNGKPYRPDDGTHHKTDGAVSYKCYNCHASSPSHSPDWNPANPFLIRFCENCHSMDSLHSIPEHVSTNHIYRVGGVGNQTVTTIEKCVACHGDSEEPDPPDVPPLPADVPIVDHLEPNFGPPGIAVDIIPAIGACWNEDPYYGLCSFGVMNSGDAVRIGQKDADDSWNWMDAQINSWSEHRIQIVIPTTILTQTLEEGKIRIEVYNEGVGSSPYKIFSVRNSPVIHSLTPSVGNWKQNIDIGGEGLGIKREKVYQNGYGYSTYVELSASSDHYRVIGYKDTDPTVKGNQWDQNKIKIQLIKLIDTNTGDLLTEQDLYPGCWNVTVITDYFKDDGDGKYYYGLSGLDTPANPQGSGAGDKLLYRKVSDPVCFTVTKDAYISSIDPNPAMSTSTAIIYGSNFGSTRGTSVVKVWNTAKTSFKTAKIRSWKNTKIKFVVSKFGTDPNNYPVDRLIRVEVAGKPASNYYPVTILAPTP